MHGIAVIAKEGTVEVNYNKCTINDCWMNWKFWRNAAVVLVVNENV
jgi:hypothetical protein